MFRFYKLHLLLLYFILIVSSFLLPGCQNATPQKSPELSFYNNLQALCKNKYAGSIVYPAGKEAPFQGKKIWIELASCSAKELRIPINIGDKVYRTLILGRNENSVFLQHENKRPDGSQAEISLYGGRAVTLTSPSLLVFPADSYSKQILGAERNCIWTLSISSDKSTLSYIAESDGRLDLQIDFNLTATL